ncbi:MAG: poly(3-hydroxybutyrate) depolymerase [Verrucomicrobiales bacterium]|jgi:poly(3-hydroxybutyrate) depolymerase
MKILRITLFLLALFELSVFGWPPTEHPTDDSKVNGRAMEIFRHGVNPEWGYQAPQEDTFVVVHPKTDRVNAPLYVVLHSAGHDVFSCVNCTKTIGNHDIYRSPEDHFALYVDCGKNKGDWWWGGMHSGDKGLIARNSGSDLVPVEKRVMATVAWAIKRYRIDPNRVYLSGNSMGGSGTLGIGLRHGDVFAAIKANVPAGVEHASERLFFPPKSIPEGVALPDPPICIDYSAQNDRWSVGHDQFAKAMNDRKYAFLFYWGAFGHANNSAKIMEKNDLIDSFDWLSVRKNEAYPAFTNASTNSQLPWPDKLDSAESGQINAFFRWKTLKDTADEVEVSLFLIPASELKTKFEIPTEASADVTLRRLQDFNLKPGAAFRWTFGSEKGLGKVDPQGLVSITGLKITNKPATLGLRPEKPDPASAKESEARLQANGKGWRLDRAKRTDTERPCVLLIGDSILNGYFRSVAKTLDGKAYVDAWVNPHWQSEGTNKLLATVLDNNGPYDVVHFNMGLHGWTKGRIKPGTYEPLTRAYVEILKTKLPEAKLIWASSTPVTAKDKRLEFDAEINPIIVEHNHMAAKVMAAAEVPVNDFYTLLADKRSLAKGDRFHWTGPAYKLLGEKAAGSILGAMADEVK